MKRIFIIGLLLAGLMVSCHKGETVSNNDSILKQAEFDEGGERCLVLVYPLTFIMPDGTAITGNNREEIDNAIKRWYNANPGADEGPALQYPVDAYFKGNPVTIDNDIQMKRYKEACSEKPCFYFIYPITYIMPDGTAITIESKDDVESKMAIRAWYAENPGVEEKPALQYPVKVKLSKDGTIKRIINDAQMSRLKESCD